MFLTEVIIFLTELISTADYQCTIELYHHGSGALNNFARELLVL